MTINEFVEQWNYKPIDLDGMFGNQCMDLMHQFCVEVLGIKDTSVLAAVDANHVWTTFSTIKGHELFYQTANTPENSPSPGDIVIWGTKIGQWGHIAICVSAGLYKFISFDQNWPTGSFCHLQEHTYNGVLGWLTLIKPMPNNLTDKQLADLKTDSNNWKFLCKKYDINDPKQIVDKVESLQTERDGFRTQLKACNDAGSEMLIELEKANKVVAEMDKIKAAYGLETFDDVDKYIRSLKEEIAITQTVEDPEPAPMPTPDTTTKPATVVVKIPVIGRILDFIKDWFTINREEK